MTRPTAPRRNDAATRRRVAAPHAGNEIRASAADEYLTIEQLAARWQLKPKTLWNWHHLKKGPPRIPLASRRYRYRLADVLDYEERHLKLSS